MNQDRIRNFCIIAHIDHGKSTLADRLLELTGTIEARNMRHQLLDRMELERERGITIKLQPVRMNYKGYQLNLIDTPGHVDFSYEVSRSLAACEGAILVVDATQGIQAQTLANVYLAIAADLTIIPVLNKIDLPAADVEHTTAEIVSLLGCAPEEVLCISAKTGQGVDKVLDWLIESVPIPKGDPNKPTRALIFDSYYDDYRGVVLYVRIVDGSITKGDHTVMMATQSKGIALEVGTLAPDLTASAKLQTGEIGYIVTNLKSTREARVGDTVAVNLSANDETQSNLVDPLPGYKDVRPFVYAGFFPDSSEHYQLLKDGIEKLSLSDSSLQFVLENSPVLGFGVRIGFLGLLHMDIVRERLEREYNLSLIITNPSTDYQVSLNNGDELDIKSASELPDPAQIREIREPWIKGEIVVPQEYVGAVVQLIAGKRGQHNNLSYIDERALITFEAPLANLLTDFYDRMKSVTSGYGSFSYELSDYRASDLVRVDFYVAGDMIESLSIMVHRSESVRIGREVVEKLKEVIPRQQFAVALQAAIGGKFIAREDVSTFRKDVTEHLYGGDVSRKKKLLAKQKRGKARMKHLGKIDIPAEAFTIMLKRD
jgi:GTP-binding protein LepA